MKAMRGCGRALLAEAQRLLQHSLQHLAAVGLVGGLRAGRRGRARARHRGRARVQQPLRELEQQRRRARRALGRLRAQRGCQPVAVARSGSAKTYTGRAHLAERVWCAAG